MRRQALLGIGEDHRDRRASGSAVAVGKSSGVLSRDPALVGGLVQQRELEGGIACDEDIARPHAARERIIVEHGPAVGWQRRPLDADLVDVGNPSGGGEDMVEFFFAVLACLAPANDDFLRPRNMRVGVPCS